MMQPYYERDGITIYHGDCREILPTLGTFDVAISDPPYGIGYESGHEGRLPRGIQGDADTTLRDWLIQSFPSLACFASWKCQPPKMPKGILIWEKPTLGMGDLSFPWGMNYEQIWVFGNVWHGNRRPAIVRAETVCTWNSGPAARLHPHQKPIAIVEQLLMCSMPTTVIDPFMGSGTTLVACKLAGIKATGIELEERYCEIAANRLAQGVLPFAD